MNYLMFEWVPLAPALVCCRRYHIALQCITNKHPTQRAACRLSVASSGVGLPWHSGARAIHPHGILAPTEFAQWNQYQKFGTLQICRKEVIYN